MLWDDTMIGGVAWEVNFWVRYFRTWKGRIYNTDDLILVGKITVGYRGIKVSNLYITTISVGYASRVCVKERALVNEVQNYLSNRPSKEVKLGSRIGWIGSTIAWLEVKCVLLVSFVKV